MKPQAFIRQLPTTSVLLDSRGDPVPSKTTENDLEASNKRYIVATCHYKVELDGTKEVRTYYIKPNEVKLMMFMSPMGKGYYGVSRILEYGSETEYSQQNLSGKWQLENEPVPAPDTIELSDLPFNERAES